jgi:hypothetical protein
MVSFIRLRQRRKVDLPQPDGTDEGGDLVVMDLDRNALQRFLLAVETRTPVGPHLGRVALSTSAGTSPGASSRGKTSRPSGSGRLSALSVGLSSCGLRGDASRGTAPSNCRGSAVSRWSCAVPYQRRSKRLRR